MGFGYSKNLLAKFVFLCKLKEVLPELPQTLNPEQRETPRDDCGVFSIHLPPALVKILKQQDLDFGELIKKSLQSLSNPGNHGFGWMVSGKGNLIKRLDKHVGNVKSFLNQNAIYFPESEVNPDHPLAIFGHLRYITSGPSDTKESKQINAHPHIGFFIDDNGKVWSCNLIHNGNIPEKLDWFIKHNLLRDGSMQAYQGSSDSAMLAQAIAEAPGNTWMEKIKYVCNKIRGSYSAILRTDQGTFVFRDVMGNRPLFQCNIKMFGNTCILFSSETTTFDMFRKNLPFWFVQEIGIKEVEPGEIVCIDNDGSETRESFLNTEIENNQAKCLLEIIYLMSNDSWAFDEATEKTVREIKKTVGKKLISLLISKGIIQADGSEQLADNTIVIGVPNGGIPYAEGLIEELNHYSLLDPFNPEARNLRAFMAETQEQRDAIAESKFKVVNPELVNGKHVLVVDDSLVRGTNAKIVVQNLFKAGASKVTLYYPLNLRQPVKI